MIVIACNSSYCFFDDLQKAVNVPIFNLRKEIGRIMDQRGIKKILVIASPTSIRNGLYEFTNIDSMPLDQEELLNIGNVIAHYNIGRIAEDEKQYIISLATRAMNDGRVIIAGCTEIQAILSNAGIDHIDPMREIQKPILHEWRISSLLEKKSSQIHGLGIFSKKSILQGDTYYWIPTENVSTAPMAKWAHFKGRWYFDDMILNWVNHSCDPNSEIVMIDGRLGMQALRDVAAGEEMTCDYNKTELDGVPVICTCGSKNCRGTFKRIE